MRRAVVSVFAVLIVIGAMLLPALFGSFDDSESDAAAETAVITNYTADFEVDADGDMSATETLDVDFPLSKHGIFRFFDIADPADSHIRYVPENIRVTRDGSSDGVDLSTERGGRYVVAKIGRADVSLSGSHRYVITYDVDGVLSDPINGARGSQFYWNLIPGGWRMPITKATLRATTPTPPQDTRCAVGAGSDAGCQASTSGNTLTVTTGSLEPNTPVTVQTALSTAAPGQKSLPWSLPFDPVFGRSVPLAIVFALLAVVAGVVSWLLARSVREPPPAYPLMYGPPEGMGPAQGAYVLTEKISDDMYAATMLELGEKGVAEIADVDGAWTITGRDGDVSRLDSVTAQTATTLGITPGQSFSAQPGDVEGGKALKAARARFDSSVTSWSQATGLMQVKGIGSIGAFLVIGAALGAGYLFFFSPFHMSLIGLPLAIFAVFALPLAAPEAKTFRTKKGREAWSHIGGFRRVLGTASSEARFDFSGRKELYTQYIPWAVAFGVAEVWAAKYRIEVGEDPPTPSYFGAGHGYAAGYGLASMSNFSADFNSSVSSAISAYQATQTTSSSSGGGGGFSGGGGGGGGGGGSW